MQCNGNIPCIIANSIIILYLLFFFGGILYILTDWTMKSTKATRSKKKF